MVKKIVESKAYRGRVLRVAIGMIVLVLVMTGGAEATIIIKDNATGGDCTSIGTWSAATKTCSMTTDLTSQNYLNVIEIVNNGVTLDGNGHTITGHGNYAGTGVYLSGRSGVTIKNLNINNFGYNYGISLSNSNNNYLTGINASNNGYGIYLDSSNNNTLNGNEASNSKIGIYLYGSNNTLSGNFANSNHRSGSGSGIYLVGSSNMLIGNNASNNDRGIYLAGSSNMLNGNNASNNYCGISLSGFNNTLINNNINSNMGSGIYLDGSSNMLTGNNVNSNTGSGIHLGSNTKNNTLSSNNVNSNERNGIFLQYSSSNTLRSNNVFNNTCGIYLSGSSSNTLSSNNANSNREKGIYLSTWLYFVYYPSINNTLIGNNANSNTGNGISLDFSSNNKLIGNNASSNTGNGIYLDSSSSNMLTGNNANSNTDYGIYIHSSSSNTLNGSNVSNNYYGISLESSSNNTVYDNFFNNTNNVQSSVSVNKWNKTKSSGTNIIGGPYLGGNFWANPGGTGFSQTCPDGDGDGVCNSIYTLDSYNIDYLPLSMNFNKDTVSPANITNLTNITYAPTYINFTWTNPPNPDYHHVMLFLNSTFLMNITAPQNYYNVTGLTPDTEYELGTHTVDRSGNINETWVNKTARTAPISGTKYSISLASGWNLISVPLMPEDTGITSVLSPINGNYSIVWAYNTSDTADHWKKYDPSAPFGNDLTTMEAGIGYWIMMTSNDTLFVTGDVPGSTDIILKAGWNLIGYNSLVGQPIENALASVSGNYSIVWAYNANDTADHWKKYDSGAPFGNDLANLEAGSGYWIMMTSDDILEI